MERNQANISPKKDEKCGSRGIVRQFGKGRVMSGEESVCLGVDGSDHFNGKAGKDLSIDTEEELWKAQSEKKSVVSKKVIEQRSLNVVEDEELSVDLKNNKLNCLPGSVLSNADKLNGIVKGRPLKELVPSDAVNRQALGEGLIKPEGDHHRMNICDSASGNLRNEKTKAATSRGGIPVTTVLKYIIECEKDLHYRLIQFERELKLIDKSELGKKIDQLRETRDKFLEGEDEKQREIQLEHFGLVADETVKCLISKRTFDWDDFKNKNEKIAIAFSQKMQNYQDYQVYVEKLISIDMKNAKRMESLELYLFDEERLQYHLGGSDYIGGTPDFIVKEAGKEGEYPGEFKSSVSKLAKTLAQVIAYCKLMKADKGLLIILGLGHFWVHVGQKEEAIFAIIVEAARKIYGRREEKRKELGLKPSDNSLMHAIQEQILQSYDALREKDWNADRKYNCKGFFDEFLSISHTFDSSDHIKNLAAPYQSEHSYESANMTDGSKVLSDIEKAFRYGNDIGLAIGSDRELRESIILHFLYMAYMLRILGLRFIFVCEGNKQAEDWQAKFIKFVEENTDDGGNHRQRIGRMTGMCKNWNGDEGRCCYFANNYKNVIEGQVVYNPLIDKFHFVFTDFGNGENPKDEYLWKATQCLLYRHRAGHFFSFADKVDVLYRADRFPRGYRNNNN